MTTEQSERTPYIRGEERLAMVADLALARETLAAWPPSMASDRLSRNRHSYRFKKLNAQIHMEIRRRARAGEQVKALAVEYGIAQHRVVHRQRAESNSTFHVKVRATQAKFVTPDRKVSRRSENPETNRVRGWTFQRFSAQIVAGP